MTTPAKNKVNNIGVSFPIVIHGGNQAALI